MSAPGDEVLLTKLRYALRRGAQNARRAQDLARDLELPASATSQKIRELARTLIMDHGVPVCAGPSGFFIARSREELAPTIRDLTHREEAIRARRSTLTRIQLGLPMRSQLPVESEPQELQQGELPL